MHTEGPFIAPSRRGAHNPAAIIPPAPAAVTELMQALAEVRRAGQSRADRGRPDGDDPAGTALPGGLSRPGRLSRPAEPGGRSRPAAEQI
ncbi:MAG: hypothetical protein ABJB47_10150 [Actinomycetota bacterium]